MAELYDTVDPFRETADSAEQPDPAHTKHGMELCSHVLFYGLSESDAENLTLTQVRTLELAGLLR